MALKIVTSQDFESEPIDEGVYETDISKLEERKQFNRFNNAEEVGISVEFNIVTEGPMKGKKAYRFFTPYITANSKLKVLCVAVLGREFDGEELALIESTADLAKHIGGKPVQVIVKQRTSQKGRVYYNLTDFLKSSRFGKEPADCEVVELSADIVEQVQAQRPAPEEPPHPVEEQTASTGDNAEITQVSVDPAKSESVVEIDVDEIDKGIQEQKKEEVKKATAKDVSDEDIEAIFGAKKATPKKA